MIDYNGRRFRPAEAAESGRVAIYRQDGDLLWGEFTGGRARRGSLAGRCAADGTLDFAYCIVLDSGEVISGHCRSTPEFRSDGGVDLREEWERYGAHASAGVSYLTEIR
ncbi:hypothetical protein GCM10029978_060560 [Actinoallomurus acanthiterrae]